MLEFYTWPTGIRLFITFFFAICVLLQTVLFVLSRYRYPKNRLRIYESIFELTLLLQILCLSLLHGQVYMGFDQGNAASNGYGILRIASFIFVVLFAVLVSCKNRRVWSLLAIISALATLPMVEIALGKAYPYLYLLSLMFLLIRSVHLSNIRYREIKTGISAFSVKEAIDNLQTGILFCRGDGRILLESRRMQELMMRISGDIQRNGVLFFKRLTSGAYDYSCERTELDEQAVCLLPDGTAWMFTRTDMKIRGRTYVELTASDVSERYRLTAELKAQDIALKKRSEELKHTIANLQDLSREQEIQKAKVRAHDVLGQRLTVLLSMARGNQALDIPLLKSLSEGLLQELRIRPEAPLPYEEMESLRQIFGSISVEVRLDGDLPENEETARLFVDIIRESITNAVRHGFASEIQIHSLMEGKYHQLRISNNGHTPKSPIVEGGGISGIREKVISRGGSLSVAPMPRFTLSITLPGDGI